MVSRLAKNGHRVVHLRLGIVLARHGGALAKMLPVFRLGLGGRLGSGRQFWSWIALEDLLRVIELALQDDRLSGAVNAVSPEPITNSGFTEALARALRRPAFLPMPAIAVKLVFGEMGRAALLASARVRPKRLIESGFEFCLSDLDAALRQTTALAWRGVRHNLPVREPLSLWGEGKASLPEWFQKLFPSRYTARNPFSSKLPNNFGLQPLPETPDGVLVSVPERALLEMLSEVGVHQGIEEARNIMEGARSLRPEVLTMLLKNCRRVKVVRLCVSWAEELNLPWATAAKKAARKPLGRARWTNRLKDGTLLVLKP